jgi:ribosome-binding factor A
MAKQPAGSGPSQRMLRVAEEVRHALSAVFARGEIHDEDLMDTRVTVTEVRASPDLMHMNCFVSGLGRRLTKEEMDGMRRIQPWLRKQVARAVRLRHAPELHFHHDDALEYAAKIDTVMRRPEVQQDLLGRPAKPGLPASESGADADPEAETE